MESGQTGLNPANVDLYSFVAEIRMMFNESARSENVLFVFETAGDLPQYIIADAGKLRQILINLIGNAMKFTDKGSIVVRLAAGQESWRILVVDDDEIHLNLTAKLLKIIGFETQEAVNGTDAVEKFREWNPHLVIMDLEMPVPEKDTTIAESIAKLPETLKLQMIDAASVADFDLLHSLIDMIGPENQEPSKLLLSLTNNFNYDYLQQVLTENKPANQSD